MAAEGATAVSEMAAEIAAEMAARRISRRIFDVPCSSHGGARRAVAERGTP
jgi:hypothetical protein